MIQLSRHDCKQVALVAEHLKAKADHVGEDVNKALRRLADETARNAEAGYNKVVGYGVLPKRLPHVYVDQDKDNYGDSFFVFATGQSVMFLEFGAGVDADPTHAWVMKAPFTVAPGSWSKDHAKLFSTNGFWFYDGEYFRSIPATRAMYNAYVYARQMIESGEWLRDEATGE